MDYNNGILFWSFLLMNIDSKVLYEKIDSERVKQNLTIYELAKRACISESTIYNWRDKESIPTLTLLESLCSVLNISFISLFLHEQQNEILDIWEKLSNNQKQSLLSFLKDTIK